MPTKVEVKAKEKPKDITTLVLNVDRLDTCHMNIWKTIILGE
jgi:hypothetical protein